MGALLKQQGKTSLTTTVGCLSFVSFPVNDILILNPHCQLQAPLSPPEKHGIIIMRSFSKPLIFCDPLLWTINQVRNGVLSWFLQNWNTMKAPLTFQSSLGVSHPRSHEWQWQTVNCTNAALVLSQNWCCCNLVDHLDTKWFQFVHLSVQIWLCWCALKSVDWPERI